MLLWASPSDDFSYFLQYLMFNCRHFSSHCRIAICCWVNAVPAGALFQCLASPCAVCRAGLRGGNGGNCPGPSAPRGPPWWHLFVLNKIFAWKIVVIQKRYKNITLYFDVALSIINNFLQVWLSANFGNHYWI